MTERDELIEDAYRIATGQSMMLATNEMLRAVIASHAEDTATLHEDREPPCICWNCVFHRTDGKEFRHQPEARSE